MSGLLCSLILLRELTILTVCAWVLRDPMAIDFWKRNYHPRG